ncbi:MAG: sensor histidine kinase [Chloroflexota bacterium]
MAAFLVAIAGVAVGLIGEQLGHGFDQVPWIPLADLATGWAMIGSGLVAAYARPLQPAGRRLVFAGFLWFVGSFMQMDDFRLGSIAFVLQGYYDLVLIVIALSFPARWPARRSERAVIVVATALYVASSIARFAARSEDIVGQQLLDPDVALPLVGWSDFARLAAVAVAGVLVIRRWVRATPTSRHIVGPVLVAGAASALAVTFGLYYPLTALGIAPALNDDINFPVSWAFNVVRIAVPFGMLLGIVRQRAARSALADAVAAAGEAPRSLDLRGVLAEAFGDPGLRVLEWDDRRATFVDERDAGFAEPPPPPAGRSTSLVRVGDRPLAVLEYDSALAQDPATVSAAVAIARLVLNNERLSAESAHRLEEVGASRARIVEAGDSERLRIERDLHDGIQQRLVALAMFLSRAQTVSGDRAGAVDSLRYGADEVLGIVQDVREFASGIHPAMLSEAGLEAAVRELADRSPIPVHLDLHLAGRGSPSALATAFFVVSEALANVAKHAAASTAWVQAEDGGPRLEIAVSDDGRGGATIGGGLAGLADRVTALGGTMAVNERPGGGTSVTASLPLG